MLGQTIPLESPVEILGVSGISANCALICVILTGLGGTLLVEELRVCPNLPSVDVGWTEHVSLTSVV
jgi:hypothetical protein